MKLEQAKTDEIRAAFNEMQSTKDLLHLLNEVKPLKYGEDTIPFELKQLTWYSNPRLAKKRYKEFKIKKKSGNERTIHSPVSGLKAIQKTLSIILQCVFEPHEAAMGFARDKSIVDNARVHAGNKYVYNIDLKDFFPSIDQARVWKCLQMHPFNLNEKFPIAQKENGEIVDFSEFYSKFENIGDKDAPISMEVFEGYEGIYLHLIKETEGQEKYVTLKFLQKKDYFQISTLEDWDELINNYEVYIGSNENRTYYRLKRKKNHRITQQSSDTSRLKIANIIASLCCTEMDVERKNKNGEWEIMKRNVLPQGAPTSPIITNIVCKRLDFILSGVAKRFGLKYSRYADDITFSSGHNVYQPESDFLKELHRIINEQGFHIKDSKTRLQKDGHRKEVTGLLVNEKVNVQKRYIKQLRLWLHRWEIFGYERASEYFIKDYKNTNLLNGQPRDEKNRVDRWNAKEFIFSGGVKRRRIISMQCVIGGKLDYLKMVKGANNESYQKLKTRYDILMGPKMESSTRQTHLSNVMEILFDKGLDEAMNYYKPSDS